MCFLERERGRPGEGDFRGIPREFVLREPAGNLWEGIRADAIDYFNRNGIRWWPGRRQPTGHMLSSQVACVNHLYLVRQRQDLAKAILCAIDPDIVEAEIVDDGYVEFEFIGAHKYLAERAFSRGANCTSVDAFMIGRTARAHRRAFLVEWKYIETYRRQDKYIPRRAHVYDDLITAEDSPFKPPGRSGTRDQIEPRALYFEPFYQLMRQTLLGWLISKYEDHGCTSYRHVHVVPDENAEFHRNVTSPLLNGATVSEAWSAVLKRPWFYIAKTPANFMRPVVEKRDTKALTDYLKRRYWSGI
jgi:hypothetical protein